MNPKDRGKAPQTPSQYEQRPTSIPRPLTPNIPLSQFPPLPYIQIASTPSMKLQNTFTPLQPEKHATTSYFTKPNHEYITQTSYTQVPDIPTLKRFTNKLFLPECLWFAEDISKKQNYYELILVDTESVDITHIPDQKYPDKTAYSKFVIKKILGAKDFPSLHSRNSFSVQYPVDGFNYFDYIQAWFRTLYYRSFDHSWFIQFHSNFISQIPEWFIEWWDYFGATQDIYPPVITHSLEEYKKFKPVNFQTMLMFHAEFHVPWILAWSFQIKQVKKDRPLALVRDFRIKWWEKYSTDRCSPVFVKATLKERQQVTQALKKIPAPPMPLPTQPTQVANQTQQEDEEEDNPAEFLQIYKFYKQIKAQEKAASSKGASSASSTEES